jgi:hypothetical protein
VQSIFEQRYNNLLQALDRIATKELSVLKHTEKAIEAVETALNELKQLNRQRAFTDVSEEIDYFKNTLPYFQSLLIYYASIFRIERCLPVGEEESRIKFIKKEQKKIHSFMEEYKDFVTYYSLGKSYQDTIYFTKQYDNEQRWQLLDIYAYGVDEGTCTRCSLLLSTVLAYKKLQKYLQEAITPERSGVVGAAFVPDDDMTWQGSITSLGELIIGLYASRIFKNPKIPLAKVSRYVCRVFGIEQINIHKVKEELRLRKKGRTPFFDTTRLNLMRFWDEEDLNAP